MNETIYNCLNTINCESEQIGRMDCLGMNIIESFKTVGNSSDVYTIITFKMQVIKSKLTYYEFPYDTEVARFYLIPTDLVPFAYNHADNVFEQKFENIDLIEVNNKFKIDIREIAFVLDVNNNVLYNYKTCGGMEILDKWIRNE